MVQPSIVWIGETVSPMASSLRTALSVFGSERRRTSVVALSMTTDWSRFSAMVVSLSILLSRAAFGLSMYIALSMQTSVMIAIIFGSLIASMPSSWRQFSNVSRNLSRPVAMAAVSVSGVRVA